MTLAKKLAGKSLAEISKSAQPYKVRRTVGRGLPPSVRVLYKAQTFANLIGMNHKAQTQALAGLSVTGLLAIIESLATELRRLNNAAADSEGVGNEQATQPSAGELGMEGLSKAQRSLIRSELEGVLETALKVNDLRKANVQLDIGTSRHVPRTLDQLEAWANERAYMAERLSSQPDIDGGSAALGVSEKSQYSASQIAKTRRQALPTDSFRSSNEPVVKSVSPEKRSVDQLPWWARSRR